jgi:hypothetical protein
MKLNWKHQNFKNLCKPISQDKTNKYKNELSHLEIALIEKICKKQMLKLGYALNVDNTYETNLISRRKNFYPLKKAVLALRKLSFSKQSYIWYRRKLFVILLKIKAALKFKYIKE